MLYLTSYALSPYDTILSDNLGRSSQTPHQQTPSTSSQCYVDSQFPVSNQLVTSAAGSSTDPNMSYYSQLAHIQSLQTSVHSSYPSPYTRSNSIDHDRQEDLMSDTLRSPQGSSSNMSSPINTEEKRGAKLEIYGDLDDMMLNWTPKEVKYKRRIVKFNKVQVGSTIKVTFEPIDVEDYKYNMACINCIYWEELNQFYVTSVDTIHLLEGIIDTKFSIEEKNRIRRNLQAFKPLTVSKGHQKFDNFFKLIMGFGAPKPRNIEKDVKVFLWYKLADALRKVVSRYSGSRTGPGGLTRFSPRTTKHKQKRQEQDIQSQSQQLQQSQLQMLPNQVLQPSYYQVSQSVSNLSNQSSGAQSTQNFQMPLYYGTYSMSQQLPVSFVPNVVQSGYGLNASGGTSADTFQYPGYSGNTQVQQSYTSHTPSNSQSQQAQYQSLQRQNLPQLSQIVDQLPTSGLKQ